MKIKILVFIILIKYLIASTPVSHFYSSSFVFFSFCECGASCKFVLSHLSCITPLADMANKHFQKRAIIPCKFAFSDITRKKSSHYICIFGAKLGVNKLRK